MTMRESKNLRLKRQYSIVAHGPDVVELRCGVWNPVSFTLTDGSGSGLLFDLISRLDGSLSVSELSKVCKISRQEVEALVDHLMELNVVESNSSNALDYYVDHIVPTLKSPTEKAYEPIPLILLGDPAIATEIARYVTASLPNVDITVPGSDDPAALALRQSDTSWMSNGLKFQEIVQVFEKWRGSFIVCAMTVINPVQLRIINRIALELRTPWLHAALDGPYLLVGPTFLPQRSACYECFETRVCMNLRQSASYLRYKEALVAGRIKWGTLPTDQVFLGLLASFSAFEIINFNLTRSCFSTGQLLSIYLPTMEFVFNEVLRLPGCSACSPSPYRDDHELYFDLRAILKED